MPHLSKVGPLGPPIPYPVTVPKYYAVASKVATIEYLRSSGLPGREWRAARGGHRRIATPAGAAELVWKRWSNGNRYLRIFLLCVVEDSHFNIHQRASGCSTSSSNASSVLPSSAGVLSDTHLNTESLHQNRREAVSEQAACD